MFQSFGGRGVKILRFRHKEAWLGGASGQRDQNAHEKRASIFSGKYQQSVGSREAEKIAWSIFSHYFLNVDLILCFICSLFSFDRVNCARGADGNFGSVSWSRETMRLGGKVPLYLFFACQDCFSRR